MSESHKFSTLAKAEEVFPELPWRASAAGDVWVYNEKEDAWVPISKGQYIVKVAGRYEVRDEEPASAHPAEPVKAEEKSDKDEE